MLSLCGVTGFILGCNLLRDGSTCDEVMAMVPHHGDHNYFFLMPEILKFGSQ